MSSYEDLMCVVDGGAFQCRPDCFAECLPDECPAHRQAIEHYEAVVQRLVSAEEAVRKLQEENLVLKGAQEKWRLERAKLITLISAETAQELPGPSKSPKSPAKKRRAYFMDREDSSKRQRVEPPSAPTPAPAPAPTPASSPFAAPVPVVMGHAARHHISIPSSSTTQASQLKPAPARRPGRPKDLALSREFFKEVVEELLQDYHGAVLSSNVPLQSSLLMEEYLHSLWATARLVTKRDRRKVVSKHDVMSALYQRADIIL